MATLQDSLHALYLLDRQVRGMRSRLDNAERRRLALQGKLDQLTQQNQELTEQIKLTQTHANTLEHQAQGIEEKINDHRAKMTQVTNNKEYSALLIEVNTLKIEKDKIEEQALTHLTQIDELKERLDQVTQKMAQQQQMVNSAASEVKQHEEEVGERLAELTVERDEAAELVPPDLRSVFDRLSDNYDGEAMAVVVEEDRRRLEYTCGGCYLTIPVERVNALYTKPDKATACPNCQRILFLDQDLKAGLGTK